MSAGSRQIDHDSLFLCRCVFDGIAQFHHQPPCSKGGHLLIWTGHVSPIHPEDLNVSLFRYLFFASMVFNMGLRGVCPMLCRLLGMPMSQVRMMRRLFMLIFDFPHGVLKPPYDVERPSHDVRRLSCESLLLAFT